jgi:hypothetical protein
MVDTWHGFGLPLGVLGGGVGPTCHAQASSNDQMVVVALFKYLGHEHSCDTYIVYKHYKTKWGESIVALSVFSARALWRLWWGLRDGLGDDHRV